MLFSPEKDVIGDDVASNIGTKWAQDYYQIVRILIVSQNFLVGYKPQKFIPGL